MRPGAHGPSLIVLSLGVSSTSSVTTRLLSLHPRTPWVPKTAHEDKITRVMVSVSTWSVCHMVSFTGVGAVVTKHAHAGPTGPGAVFLPTHYLFFPGSAL